MRHYSEKEKRQWLSEWASSGQSIRTYTKDKPFSIASFNNWRRQINKEKKTSSFIQLTPPPSKPSQGYARLTYPTGVVLELYVPLDVSALKALVQ